MLCMMCSFDVLPELGGRYVLLFRLIFHTYINTYRCVKSHVGFEYTDQHYGINASEN